MNEQLIYINLLTQLELVMHIALFAILSVGATIWTHIQWIRYRNIRDTARKQKILDDINLKISEDNRLADAKKIAAATPLSPMPTNVTPITVKRGEGIWEPSKR
jgi:hypothetical protein